MAKLHIIAGQDAGCKFELGKGTTTIGRLNKNEICVDQDKISREHAEINFHDGGYYIRDLGSANGTYLNKVRITKEKLCKPGDNIRIGDVIFRFFPDDDYSSKIKIPGYKIEELIGQGGMGRVFRAVQISMDRHVALKVLRSDLSGKEKFVTRFLHEARAAGKLNHPNLIHVNDAGKAGDTYYFSMELVSGNDLSQLMAYRDFDHTELFRIAAKVADALECAHRRGIIHRDIKPENIILTEDGEVKLADLGVAKIFDLEERGPSQPKVKSVLGTPHYMSPEQASGQDVDCRTDLYSLGATLYHALSGQPPFEDSTHQAVMRKQITEEPEPLENLCPRLPPEAANLVKKLMMKNREDRFATAAEARDALEKASRISCRPTPPASLKIPYAAALDAEDLSLNEELGWGDRARETPAWGQVLFVAGMVIIALAASLVFAGNRPAQNPAAQKILDQGWALEMAGKFNQADEKYSDVLIRFPEDKDSSNLAQGYRTLLAARKKRIHEKTQETARRKAMTMWDEFEAWRRNNEGDLDGWQERLDQLEKTYAATAFNDLRERVIESKRELRRARMQAIIKKQNEAFYQAQRAANEVRTTYKFAEAIALLTAYRKSYPDSIRKSEVEYLLKQVNSEQAKALAAEAETFANATKRAARQLADAKFSDVIPVYENFLKTAKFAEYRARAQAAIAAAKKNIDLAVDRHMAKNKTAVLAALRRMDTEKAEALLENEKAILAGTKDEAKLEKRLRSIRLLKKFHAQMIAKIKAEGGRETNLIVANYLNGTKPLRIIDANRKGLVLMPGARVKFTLEWGRIEPAEMVAIYRLYADPNNAEQTQAIHIYSLIFGLRENQP